MQKIIGKMGYFERIALELFLEKKTTSLNDFIEIPKRRQFRKMMQLLEVQGVNRHLSGVSFINAFTGLSAFRHQSSTTLTARSAVSSSA